MAKGKLAIVLHAHLPYVRSKVPGSLEEDWYFQALMECYLPLLKILEDSAKAKDLNPKLTISLSPTLLSLLNDEELKTRFPKWLKVRLNLLTSVERSQKEAADFLAKNINIQLDNWSNCEGDLIKRFSNLEDLQVLDILTCAATHGYLPLLRENIECVNAQLSTAVREHFRFFGKTPQGIWLPECAYYEGLDSLMSQNGLRYSILDGHGILHAKPRPRYGIYAPICTKNGVAFFGRDSDSTLPVWSSRQGYPGNGEYREFHRDLGWDLPLEILNKNGIKEPRPLCLKLNKVTSQQTSLNKKDFYKPEVAANTVRKHALDYLLGKKLQLQKLYQAIDQSPVLIAPFDAELFGHWWFEGPSFLYEIFKQANEQEIEFTRLNDVLRETSSIQLCEPCPSSWGQGGFHKYWLNASNSWLISEWSKAGRAMIEICNVGVEKKSDLRVIQQAARELLLSQSSDWSFILRAGTTTELAKERINRHLKRFWSLIESLENKETFSESTLIDFEEEDSIFPLIQANDWKTLS
ncbi:1,4-alpha-glucan branching protein domain-containing protein [Prochlorococcus marinus]|uniref:1,4-alpha-glucan branching protein domain-containing protein n=1 Tax=Prochlorococcus marinus TaxID=1219 RepID=UPI00056A5D3D|nr:1,4-alpha-glucan branching protein domain-containing protein [Prochlorococcus marinus]